MLSTSSASAACHAARSSSTVVACGCSCTPTLNRAMWTPSADGRGEATRDAWGLRLLQLDATAAVPQHQRRLAMEQPLQRLADEFLPPALREATRPVVQQRGEIGACGEKRGVEIELGRTLGQPRAEHGAGGRQPPVDAIRLRHAEV